MLTSSSLNARYKGSLFAAEYFFILKDYSEAFKYYINASKYNPNKAILYGFAGNCLLKEKSNFMLGCFLNYQAIKLDPTNARWYFYHSLLLANLRNDLDLRLFTKPMHYYLDTAIELLRPEQKQLRNALLRLRQ